VLEQCVIADKYLNFLTRELLLLMEDMPLETRHRTFQHNGVLHILVVKSQLA
jgi:hypothetical protein